MCVFPLASLISKLHFVNCTAAKLKCTCWQIRAKKQANENTRLSLATTKAQT